LGVDVVGRGKMKVLHTSDLHGSYKGLLRTDIDFDVWVDTGDFFPNRTRGDRTVEVGYQARWLALKSLPERLAAWLDGRPLISVPGNHDYVSLSAALRGAGAEAHEVTPAGVTVGGLTWAGFREIPWIAGEWNGETHDFGALIEATWETQPDVLVTHAPAGGILDGGTGKGYGIPGLASALSWKPHTIKAHLFGHTHECGGQSVSEVGVLFANGAGTASVHTL